MATYKRFIAALMLGVLGLSGSAIAVADTTYNFNLPQQPLAEALKAIGRQTATNILFDPEIVEKATAPALQGTLSVQEAIRRSILGTDLVVREMGASSVVVAHVNSSAQVDADESNKKLDAEGRLAGSPKDCSGLSSDKMDSSTSLRQSGAESVAAGWAGSDAGNGCKSGKSQGDLALARVEEGEAVQANDGTSSLNRDLTEKYKIQEIVVTAQKRQERLQDTPISIGVLSGSDLDRSSSRGVSDVLTEVGGVTVIEAQPGNARIFIRGMAPNVDVGTSTAGFYLDEMPFVFVTKSELPDANAFDLSRVEVLRGPQGTLYGSSALSGVVRVLTNDADVNEFEVKARARASTTEGGEGNYGGDAALNVPLIDGKLAVRGVASRSNLSGFISSDFDGEEYINDSQAQSYRLKLKYQATDAFGISVGISRSDIQNGAPSRSTPQFTTPVSSNTPDDRVYDAYNVIANYDFAAGSLISSTSYVDYVASTEIATPFLFLGVPLSLLNDLHLRSFAQEIRFASNLEGPWRYSVGGMYKDTEEFVLQDAPAIFNSPYEEKNHSESFALFGEVTRSFQDDRFEVTAGLRYFEDDVVNTHLQDFFNVLQPEVSATFHRVTGRTVLTFKPTNNQTLYASVATGFRSGINQNFAVQPLAPDLPALGPDSLINYELGVKGALLGGALRYDTSLYYIKWTDIQQNIALPPPLAFNAYINAGKAEGVGIDGSLDYQISEAFSLHASAGWNGLELEEDVFSGGELLYEKGSRVNRSPEWSGSLGATYRAPIPVANVDLVVSGTYTYRTEILNRYLTANGPVTDSSDDVQLFNASVGIARDQWSLDLYGDNLLNKNVAVDAPDSTGTGFAIRQRPRTIGLQFTYNN